MWILLFLASPSPKDCATVDAARDIFCSNIITKVFWRDYQDYQMLNFQKNEKNLICLMFTSTRQLQDWIAVGKRQILTECPPQTLTLVDGLSWLFP